MALDFPDAGWGPARRLATVVPNDGADLPGGAPKALLVTAGGSLVVAAIDDTGAGVSLGTQPAGAVLPIRARRVYATGTSASVVALY